MGFVLEDAMARAWTITITIMLLISMIGTGPLAAAASDETHESDDPAPGEQLAGVVEVQDAELDGELDQRAFGIAVATAANDSAKANVVADQMTDVEERLDELDQRKADLDEQREAGEISHGRYAAETAQLATEVDTAEQLLNASEQETDGLPAELLKERGVNASAIGTLQERADELNGPEVADIARSIAGNSSGAPTGPDQAGPPMNEMETDDESTERDDGMDAPDDESTETQSTTDDSTERNETDESNERDEHDDQSEATDTDADENRDRGR